VDQVGEQRDRAGEDEDDNLDKRRCAEHRQADRNGPDALARAHDRAVDKSVRMGVPAVLTVIRGA